MIYPQRCLVIRPDTLSLFLLSSVEFHVSILQDTHQAAAESPASFDSVLIYKSVVRRYWFLLLETFAAIRRPPLHHYVFDNVKYSNDTLPSRKSEGLVLPL